AKICNRINSIEAQRTKLAQQQEKLFVKLIVVLSDYTLTEKDINDMYADEAIKDISRFRINTAYTELINSHSDIAFDKEKARAFLIGKFAPKERMLEPDL